MGASAESWMDQAKKSASLREASTHSTAPAPAGGQYHTEVIGGRSFTSFVPSNVKVYSGSKSKGDAVQIAGKPDEAAPKTERLEYGNIVIDKNVPVSGSVFKMMEEKRLGGQPMSIRTDVPYLVTVRQDRTGYNYKVQDQSIAPSPFGGGSFKGGGVTGSFERKDVSGKIQAWFDQDSNAFMDRQIEFLTAWEKGAAKRSSNVDEFFLKGVQSSPFRGGKPLNWGEELGARGLAIPGHLVTSAPEQLALDAGKAVVFAETIYFPKYGARAAEAHKDAIGQVPIVVASTFDVRKPSGVANLAAAVAAPSFYAKGINTIKSIAYIGKTKIPADQTIDPRILTGKETFPKSYGTAKDMKAEFDNSEYVANVNRIIKEDAPAANTFLPKNRGSSQLDILGKGQKGLLNLGSRGKAFEDLPASGSKVLYVDNWGNTFVVESPSPRVRGGFTASPGKIQTGKGVLAGSSETPGGYIAPSLSKYFLKLQGSERSVKVGLLPSVQSPSANLIDTKVGLIPGGFVKDAEVAAGARIGLGGSDVAGMGKAQRGAALGELNKFFENDLKGSGKSAVSPEFYLGKQESEAIIGQESGLKDLRPNYNVWDRITGFKYYQEIDGAKVPFRIIEATPAKGTGFVARIEQGLAERSISSSERIGVVDVPALAIGGASRGAGGRSRGGSSSRMGSSMILPPSSPLPSSSGGGSSSFSGYPIPSMPSSRGRSPSISMPSSGGGGSRSRTMPSMPSISIPESRASRASRILGDNGNALGFPSINFGGSPKRSTPKSRLVPFKPKYFASIEATALGIHGKPNKRSSIIAGLDIRPMRF